MVETQFDYTLRENAGWPPMVRPRPPFGPSSIEVMRSCPLRSLFDASPGYERRMGYAARVGTAFHRTLQSFYEDGLPGSIDEAVAEARARFEQELRYQQNEANSRPRERSQYRDPTRVERALEAIVLEAVRFVEAGYFPANHRSSDHSLASSSQEENRLPETAQPPIEVEISVRSADGLFHGRIDRVAHTPEGDILFDFKSALRDDLPERYERQLQLYAFMYHDTRGSWPTAAHVIYPLAGKAHEVSIEPERCQTVAAESAAVVGRLLRDGPITSLAEPGEVCSVCEYRPWCKPFWNWQAGEASHPRALERAIYGFAGTLTRLELIDHRWQLAIAWRRAVVRLSAPEERLPHLHKAKLGHQVFVLDAKLQGSPFQPVAIFTENSELFLIT